VLGLCDDDLEVEGGVSDLDTFIEKLSDDTKGPAGNSARIRQSHDADSTGSAKGMACQMGHGVKRGKMQGDARRAHSPQYESYCMKGKRMATPEEEKDVDMCVTKNLEPSTQGVAEWQPEQQLYCISS
jgi:hypothetical protein